MKRIILATLAVLFFLTPSARAQNACSFDYITDAGLLKTVFTELPADKLRGDSDLLSVMQKALPNVQRVFDADRHYMALVGASSLPEDYSKYTDMQAERTLVQGAELAKRKFPSGGFTYKTDFGPPISAVYTIDYIDHDKPYRDLAMDVIASSHCLFSIKISASRTPNDDAAWARFAEEFTRIKAAIADHEGPVSYSREGRSFSRTGIINNMMYVGIGVIFAAIIAYGLRRRYEIKPGGAARIYSAAIVVLCVISLGFLALLMSGDGPNFDTYDGFTPIFLVFVVHLIALIKRSPMTVLSAISLMLGLLISRTIYMAFGWMTLPRSSEAVWMLLSFALLIYAIVGTFRKTEAVPGPADA